MTPEQAAKKNLADVVAAAATTFVAEKWPPGALQGVAYHDMARDNRITKLGPFLALVSALGGIPLVLARFGETQLTRLALQLIYEYFATVKEPRLVDASVDTTWARFMAELEDANWTTRGVANLQNFSSPTEHIDLEDGISIRGRNLQDLASLGFAPMALDELLSDWAGFGSSSFVIVAESAAPKDGSDPGNLLSIDSGVWIKAIRAIGALRLLKGGDVSIGPMWATRVAQFNVGSGGLHVIGVKIPAMGSTYVWTEEMRSRYATTYAELAKLEKVGYGRAPGNLDLALRAFMGTYDRWPSGADSRLLDSITALEAVLGSGTEIAFKLAFRVSSLCAEDDEERAALLATLKGFYDTRSALVHGGRLKETHQQRLANVDELRDIVRRLLRAFVALAAGDGEEYSKAFFQEQLDTALVNATQRNKLRRGLGLTTGKPQGSM